MGRWRCICDAERRERLGVSKREVTEVGRGQREKGLEFQTTEQELSTRHGRARANLQTGDLELAACSRKITPTATWRADSHGRG